MTTPLADQETLTPAFKPSDPYSWLAGDDKYELPPEWLAMRADVPEKHSAKVLASIHAERYAP